LAVVLSAGFCAFLRALRLQASERFAGMTQMLDFRKNESANTRRIAKALGKTAIR
jgi:hypothetical protein